MNHTRDFFILTLWISWLLPNFSPLQCLRVRFLGHRICTSLPYLYQQFSLPRGVSGSQLTWRHYCSSCLLSTWCYPHCHFCPSDKSPRCSVYFSSSFSSLPIFPPSPLPLRPHVSLPLLGSCLPHLISCYLLTALFRTSIHFCLFLTLKNEFPGLQKHLDWEAACGASTGRPGFRSQGKRQIPRAFRPG